MRPGEAGKDGRGEGEEEDGWVLRECLDAERREDGGESL